MSGPTPESTHASSTSEHECRNVIVTESGARVCADTGVVLDDEPLDVGKDFRAFDTEEFVQRMHAHPATPGAPVGTIISMSEDVELAELNMRLVRRDIGLVRQAEDALREVLGDAWLDLSEDMRDELVYTVKRAFDIIRAHGYRLTTCVTRYTAYIIARSRGLRARNDCKPWQNDTVRRVARILANHGFVVKADVREETLRHVMQCAEKLRLDTDVKHLALNLAKHVSTLFTRKPSVMAAAAIYLAVRILQRSVRQATIAATCNVSDASIRNALHEFLKHHDVIVLLGS